MKHKEQLRIPKNESPDREISNYKIVSDKYFFEMNQKDFPNNNMKISNYSLKSLEFTFHFY